MPAPAASADLGSAMATDDIAHFNEAEARDRLDTRWSIAG
jgi:hypothetical protein